MNAKSWLTTPDNVNATIQLTMTLREWKEVREALESCQSGGPWQVNRVVYECIRKMETHFYPRTEAPSTEAE